MTTDRYLVPTWALDYLINGDTSSLEFGEKDMIDDWQKRNGILDVFCPDDIDSEKYFTPCPPFGRACDVVECECVVSWNDAEEPFLSTEEEYLYHHGEPDN